MQPGEPEVLSHQHIMQEDHFRQKGLPSEGEAKTKLQLAHGAR